MGDKKEKNLTLHPAVLELWAGVECTVNRVGNRFYNQLECNGHLTRPTDLERFAALGIKAIRYPVLWELTAPDGLATADWSWADERLRCLADLNIRPIVGLIHHGSGPRYTSLVDPEFPKKLSEYARAVAERYPWVEDYTPVNEPLTTARFSGLYGLWYPHGRDDLTFARALFNQCRAVALSMQTIRQVNPRARLVQTEDLGKVYSTRKLQYQADFENHRRWLTFDLLAGRLGPEHPLWDYFRDLGIAEEELDWFRENPCPPDVLGVNYYVTSERFLDDRLELYPSCMHGGNGRDRYVDVEAVRVSSEGIAGVKVVLREAWERYGQRLAITEAHLGCSREEQLRWLKEVWDEAFELRQEGADIQAVTAWALLGSFDWNSLLTECAGFYESGVFDLRSPEPRPTVIAKMLQEVARGGEFRHPVLAAPGWWRRPERLLYAPYSVECLASETEKRVMKATKTVESRPILITGATGTLGRAFARICAIRGLPHRLLSRREMDIADPASIEKVFQELKPWAVINAAGYVRVDDAEHEPDRCFRENTLGPVFLAEACDRHQATLVTFSSDLVFNGRRSSPYLEHHQVAPLNVYGRSKAEAERQVLAALPSALIIRTSAFFGPWDKYNFVWVARSILAAKQPFTVADDIIVSPTYVPDLVNSTLDLLIDGETGIWHLTNDGALSWAELAHKIAEIAKLDAGLIEGRPSKNLKFTALRPKYSALSSKRGICLPSLEAAVARYFDECAV